MAQRRHPWILNFWRAGRGGSLNPAFLDSALPDYSPLGIAPPLARGRRRLPWMMTGALLALGTPAAIAFNR